MIRVEIIEAYGTGAGYGTSPHQYWSFKGEGITLRSVKEAVRMAKEAIRRSPDYSEGASWIPVLGEMRIYIKGKLAARREID